MILFSSNSFGLNKKLFGNWEFFLTVGHRFSSCCQNCIFRVRGNILRKSYSFPQSFLLFHQFRTLNRTFLVFWRKLFRSVVKAAFSVTDGTLWLFSGDSQIYSVNVGLWTKKKRLGTRRKKIPGLVEKAINLSRVNFGEKTISWKFINFHCFPCVNETFS